MARSYSRVRHSRARASSAGTLPPLPLRASQAASSVSTRRMPGMLLPISSFQLPTTRSISAPGAAAIDVADPFERHQQVADAFDPHEQNASGLRRPFPPERACHRRDHTERGIGRAHERALARLVDLQVREHAVPAILPARDPVTIDRSPVVSARTGCLRSLVNWAALAIPH